MTWQPADALRRLVEFTWNYYLEHPEFLTLLNSANLHRARHLQRRAACSRTELALACRRWARFSSGVGAKARLFSRRHRPRSAVRVDRRLCAWFYLSNKHTLSAIFDRDLMARPRHEQERLSHMVDVILGYVLRD
jgi:hypothetical protein